MKKLSIPGNAVICTSKITPANVTFSSLFKYVVHLHECVAVLFDGKNTSLIRDGMVITHSILNKSLLLVSTKKKNLSLQFDSTVRNPQTNSSISIGFTMNIKCRIKDPELLIRKLNNGAHNYSAVIKRELHGAYLPVLYALSATRLENIEDGFRKAMFKATCHALGPLGIHIDDVLECENFTINGVRRVSNSHSTGMHHHRDASNKRAAI